MQQKVSVVFRKTGLRAFQPACLYAYLSAPTSAIVAKMSVTSYEYLDVEEAIQLAGKGQISIEELRAYATNYSKLLVYRIGKVYMAKHPATFQKLSSEYDFWPSSTFIPLSKTGATTLDRICSFYDVTQR
jgi:predicted transcriptional regulator